MLLWTCVCVGYVVIPFWGNPLGEGSGRNVSPFLQSCVVSIGSIFTLSVFLLCLLWLSLWLFLSFFYWASSTLSISVVFNILSSFYFPLLLSLSLSFSRHWAVCSLLHVDTVALAIIGRKKEKQKRQGKKWDGEKGRRVVAARGPGQCLLLILV